MDVSETAPYWARIDDCGAKTVAIVGVSKHAGKTSVLCRLLGAAQGTKRALAVMSVGIDGERVDSVLGTPKPRIWLAAGTLFATAVKALPSGTSSVQWLEPADISSPLGEVWVGRILEESAVVLAGVRQLAHLQRLKIMFQRYGAENVLIDGALDRQVALHPDVADGAILATGAVLGTLSQVTKVTREALLRLTAPLADQAVWKLMREMSAQGIVPVAGDGSQGSVAGVITARFAEATADWTDGHYFPTAHAFAGDLRELAPKTAGVDGQVNSPQLFICRGAVTDSVLRALTNRLQPQCLVAPDPAHLFVSVEAWQAFARAGHTVQVLRKVPLIAVTINPHSPRGPGLDRRTLLDSVQALTDVPVWDVMEG